MDLSISVHVAAETYIFFNGVKEGTGTGFKSQHVDSNVPWKPYILYECGTWYFPRREEHGISLWTRQWKKYLDETRS